MDAVNHPKEPYAWWFQLAHVDYQLPLYVRLALPRVKKKVLQEKLARRYILDDFCDDLSPPVMEYEAHQDPVG
jgi:hypothetical protein